MTPSLPFDDCEFDESEELDEQPGEHEGPDEQPGDDLPFISPFDDKDCIVNV